jgi:hypothetical protein
MRFKYTSYGEKKLKIKQPVDSVLLTFFHDVVFSVLCFSVMIHFHPDRDLQRFWANKNCFEKITIQTKKLQFNAPQAMHKLAKTKYT